MGTIWDRNDLVWYSAKVLKACPKIDGQSAKHLYGHRIESVLKLGCACSVAKIPETGRWLVAFPSRHLMNVSEEWAKEHLRTDRNRDRCAKLDGGVGKRVHEHYNWEMSR